MANKLVQLSRNRKRTPPRREVLLSVAVIAVVIGSLGCGASWRVGRGISDYEEKSYDLAIEDFDEVSRQISDGSLDDKATARYYVYRGLCHYERWKKNSDKGERRRAVRHLGKGVRLRKKEAKAEGDEDWFPADVVTHLDKALADVGIDTEREAGDGWTGG